MFDALADEPVMVVKPAAAPVAAATKPGSKSLVGGVKKGDAPKRDSQASSSLPTSHGKLPGEVRKETGKGRHKQHVVRTDANGKIHGREFERHSQTGRPAHENKRSGAGRNNWGALKDAKEDEDMAAAAAAAPEAVAAPEAATTEAAAVPATEAVAESSEPKVEAEPEIKTQSLAAYRAEKAKKEKELAASLGLGPLPQAREIKPTWYKPEEKSAAAAPKASSSAAKEVKQHKTFVPISQVIGEKKEFRAEDRRGPRRDREGSDRQGGDRQHKPREGGNREGGNREGGNREGGNREGGNREGGNREGGNREGGNREGGNRQGGRGGNRTGGKTARATFDATAGVDKLPALGQ